MTAAAISFASADVVAAQSGDRDAFARLVDATSSVVCAITFAILRDPSASEDIAQDVFVAAWSSLAKLRSPSSFLPWIRQLARNRAHEAIRTRVRDRRRSAPWDDAIAQVVADRAPTAPMALEEREERAALEAALEALPEETREIVILFYREGGSVAQVATLLDLSEDAVKKRLERARATIKTHVLARFEEVAKKTAPTAAFVLAVSAAIAVSAPGTAAAAGSAGIGVAKVAGAGSGWKLAALLLGPLGGFLSAFGAIGFGFRQLYTRANSTKERRKLRLFGVVNMTLLLVATASWLLLPRTAPLWLCATPSLVYVIGLTLSYTFWLPRIVVRTRRDRVLSLVGTTIGLVCGLAGLAYGLMHR